MTPPYWLRKAFKHGEAQAQIHSTKDVILRAFQVATPAIVAWNLPIAWYWRVASFLGMLFIVGMVVTSLKARGDRLRGLRAAKAVGEMVEANRRQINSDTDRLLSIMQGVSARIGGACVSYNENGEVFLHPDLAEELQKPGNEALNEILLMGTRNGFRE